MRVYISLCFRHRPLHYIRLAQYTCVSPTPLTATILRYLQFPAYPLKAAYHSSAFPPCYIVLLLLCTAPLPLPTPSYFHHLYINPSFAFPRYLVSPSLAPIQPITRTRTHAIIHTCCCLITQLVHHHLQLSLSHSLSFSLSLYALSLLHPHRNALPHSSFIIYSIARRSVATHTSP